MKSALLVFVLACGGSSSPAPQAPADKPPLPPASGTPIGYIIDDATDLHLRDDQLTQLRQLDTQLSADLDAIDTRMRAAAPHPDASQQQSQMGGMGGGGRHRGGGGRGRRGGGQQQQHTAPTGDPGATDKLTEQRRADVKDALAKAFTILDTSQQTAAKKLLQDHDVDLDEGSTGKPSSEGDGTEQPEPEPAPEN